MEGMVWGLGPFKYYLTDEGVLGSAKCHVNFFSLQTLILMRLEGKNAMFV